MIPIVLVLFCVLLHSILEYGSIIWNPATISRIEKLERVQRKLFIYFIGYKRSITNTTGGTLVQSPQFNLNLILS